MPSSNEPHSNARMVCPKCGKTYEDAQQHPGGVCPLDQALLQSLEADPLAGQLIAEKYQLIHPMEAGGWSVVYRARHVHLQKDVAVKVLHWHLSLNEDKVRRFHQEAEAASKLNHPNIVSIFDYGTLESGQPYFVMELVQGESLKDILERDGPLDATRAAQLFRQAALALAAAHKHGVLHRDLKPSNMMVTRQDAELTPSAENLKLLDFGIAKIMTDVADDEKLTLTGETVGTPRYMSPEQCLGKPLDPRSDIYSLGCVMFEMLSGQACVEGATAYDYMHGHVGTEPRSFKDVRADLDIPKPLQDVIYTMLAKHPDDRQPSMEALSGELEQIARGESTFHFRRLRFRREWKTKAKQMALFVLVPVVVSALTAITLRSYLNPPAAAPDEGLRTVSIDPTKDDGNSVNTRAEMVTSVNAPEFPSGDAWLNVKEPLRMQDLKGKVVLLDFWTYCCVNCLNAMPQVERLKEKFGDRLVVIGVHSAKFENEKETNNIRQAIVRWNIDFPVVNDADFKIWKSYGVTAWPTLIVIGPDGKIVHQNPGEGNFNVLSHIIEDAIQSAPEAGDAPAARLPAPALERDKQPASPLLYPAKICADPAGNRIFIADSGHNRIVIARPDGEVLETIGTGTPGKQDGRFEQATFNEPQGLCYSNGVIYVADTLSHAIRTIDLSTRSVATIAGTGSRAGILHKRGGQALKTPINFPRDLVIIGDKLYISMAGFHQLWTLDLKTHQVGTFAGNGKQSLIDGPPLRAELAQPCGIATDGKRLYFADSETSAIRSAEPVSGDVTTLVGHGLYDSGDRDGQFPASRLQHPIGIAPYNGLLYITDAFNHKIKVLDPQKATATTLVGSGKAGRADGDFPEFFEPAGLVVLPDQVLIADTNNHVIRSVSLSTGNVSTLQLQGLKPPQSAPTKPSRG